MSRSLLFNAIAITIFFTGIILYFQNQKPTIAVPAVPHSETSAVSAVTVSASSATPSPSASTTQVTHIATNARVATTVSAIPARNKAIIQLPTREKPPEVARVQSPYESSPLPFDTINVIARGALVNILCEPDSGSLRPISGSGVLVDPRGIILTNAHVAQYVLLSESSKIDLACTIRTGAPAQPAWKASVMFIPSVWVTAHASEILQTHPIGTGEHDYALLYVTGSANGSALPSQFPYLPVDTREAIGFPGDQVLAAAYPAEFVGGIAAQNDLYSASSVTTIKQLFTFGGGTADLFSVGGVIEAQGGSSGGAIVNAWGRLVGVITTTSDATTTADRDLHSIALSYINTDMAKQTGINLIDTLSKDPAGITQTFTARTAPQLIQKYIDVLGTTANQ